MKFTGKDIRVLRMSRQLKQSYIADKLKISKQRYSQIENQQQQLLESRVDEILSILSFTRGGAESLLQSLYANEP